ncbi:MAG: NAD-binding protein [Dongiaceae bacterium]
MFAHSSAHDKKTVWPLKWPDWIWIGLAILTIVLGLIGFSEAPDRVSDPACTHAHDFGIEGSGSLLDRAHQFFAHHFVERLYRTLLLFEPGEDNLQIGICYKHWTLAVARLSGPAAIILGGARGVWGLVQYMRGRRRLRRGSGHTVIIGLGAKGRVRAADEAAGGARVVVIESQPDDAAEAFAGVHGVLLLAGDGRNRTVWERARIGHAGRIIVATGDDTRNLAVARMLADSPCGAVIETSIDDPLIRRTLSAADADAGIEPFALGELAAHALCETARFGEIADLRGQPGVHVVFLGLGPCGPALVAQILRTSLLAGHGRPNVTVLCPRPPEARDALRLRYPEILEAASFAFVEFDPAHQPLDDEALMRRVAQASPVTAVIVPPEAGGTPLAIALAAQEGMRRAGLWAAPVFFAADATEGLHRTQKPLNATLRYSEVLQSFIVGPDLCARARLAERDAAAQALHAGYLRTQEAMRRKGLIPSSAERSLVPWDKLPLTYRQANRRVADHVTAKLLSAGCFAPRRGSGELRVPPGFDLLAEPEMLDRLSRLEHEAWMIDRRLEGWRPGSPRDDVRRIHDCLLPYDDLPPPTRELDRAQVRELNDARLVREPGHGAGGLPLVRFDLWIGIIGTIRLSGAEAVWLAQAIGDQVVPRILAMHPDHHITVLSPCAPGSDLIATKAALSALRKRKQPHRLLAVEAVPISDVVEDFSPCWQAGCVADSTGIDASTWEEARPQIGRAIAALHEGEGCERVIELDRLPGGAAEADRAQAYRRQNAFLVQRAHILVAAVKGPTQARPGGTWEAVSWRRSLPSLPADQPRYAARPNKPARTAPHLVLVNVEAMRIDEEAAPGS